MKFKPINALTGIIATNIAPIAVKDKPIFTDFKIPLMSDIYLTEQQENQIKNLRRSARSQIEGTLTQLQKTQFNTAIVNGANIKADLSGMNLFSEQKSQIKTILQSSRQQLQSLLTHEQQQQFLKNLRSESIKLRDLARSCLSPEL
jgi:uncharacterized protein YbbC (DUF1343 family)